MARTNGPIRAARQYDADRNSHFNDETPLVAGLSEDPFDDLVAELTSGHDFEPANSISAGFPPAEELYSDDVAAKSMASNLAPNRKPRPKIRRYRFRRAERDRWRSPHEQAERDEPDEGYFADRWSAPQSVETSRWRRSAMVWGISAGILMVAAFALVKPSNGVLPNRMGEVADETVASLADRGETVAEAQEARNGVGLDSRSPGSEKPVATVAIPRVTSFPISQAAAASSAQPSVAGGGSETGRETRTLAVAGNQAFDTGATALPSGTSNSAAGNSAVAEPRSASAEKSEERLYEPALQRSAQAGPAPTVDSSAGAGEPANEPVSGEAQPVELQLPAAQADRLLARGKELLEYGNIAAARLMFSRVAAAGDPRGAMGVGMTYDPDVYARLAVTGIAPDREQAEFWYDKAGQVPKFTIIAKTAPSTPEAPASPVAPAKPATPATLQAGSSDRNAACARKYNSFDPSTGLYTSYSGVKRPCRLP